MTRHVLITGGAGCIGSDLAEVLVHRGERVTVYDNLSSGRREHIESLMASPRFHFIEADMLDKAALYAALHGVDRVWHLAANPDVKFTPGDATDKDLQQNTIATHNLLDAMKRHGIKELAFSSTSAVYGICEKLPINEEQAPRPISLYGASKLACEALIGAFQNLFEMRCWIFRFANIVGSKVRSRGRTVIGDFIYRLREDPRMLKILGNGKQAKSYLLSSECVDAMVHCVEHAKEPLNYFNLGSNDYLTVTRIADLVVEAMGLKNVAYEYTGGEGGWPGDVPRFLLDVSAVNAIGWRPTRNSEDAVKYAIDSALAVLAADERACINMAQQAVILAGGLGTRLWPLTKEVPKPMMPIHGVPYLEHQLRLLAEQSITNIVLLIGYLGEQIEQHFGSGERFGLSIAYSWEKTPQGTGGALREAHSHLADSFLLLYGDSFLPMRYTQVLETLQTQPAALGAVVVYDNHHGDTDVKNNIALNAAGFVRRYDKDVVGDPDLTYVEAGVSAFRREVVDLIPPGKVSLENEIFPRLIAANQLAAVVTTQRFYDIGTPDRLKTIANYFQS